jgi:hypothetical protein
VGSSWPSHKARYFRREILEKRLGYAVVPGSKQSGGSHVWLEAPGRPRIRWAFHNKRTITPIEVRRILLRQVGMTEAEAREVLGIG